VRQYETLSYIRDDLRIAANEDKQERQELTARIAELEAEIRNWQDCYCGFETIAPDGNLKISVLDLYNRITELNARIAEFEAERRWIPFDWEHKENQPDHMQVCLVLTADNEMYSAMFLSDNCWTGLCRDFGRDEVAYWMQSPEPPEVK